MPKFGSYDAAASLGGTEETVVKQSGATKRATVNQIRAYILPTTSSLLKGDGAGGASAATAGTDYPGLATANVFAEAQTINTVKSAAGSAFAAQATAPAQAASSQAGADASLAASDAVAGSSNAGAANGGAVTVAAGDAKRLTSGNGDGGHVTIRAGALIGSGTRGRVIAQPGGAAGPTLNFQSGWNPGTSSDFQATQLVIRGESSFIIYAPSGKVVPGFNDNQDFGDNSTRFRHLYLSGVVEHSQISTPAAPNTNCAKSYAKDVAGTAELFAMDEGGTETQQTPHAIAISPFKDDPSDPFPYVFHDKNQFVGVERFINLSRVAYFLQAMFPHEQFIVDRDLPKDEWLDWHENQARLQAENDARLKEEREANILDLARSRRAEIVLQGMLEAARKAGLSQDAINNIMVDPATVLPLAADIEVATELVLKSRGPLVLPDIRKPAPAWLRPRMANDYDNTRKPKLNWKQRFFAWLMS